MGLGMPTGLRMPNIAWPAKWETLFVPDMGTVLTGALDISVREDRWKLLLDKRREVYGLTDAGSLVGLGNLPQAEFETLLATGQVTWTWPPEGNGESIVLKFSLIEKMIMLLSYS